MRQAWQYMRFLLPYPLLMCATAGMFAGGAWMWTGVAMLAVLAIVGDELLPSNAGNPQYRRPFFMDAMLFATLPLIVAMYVALIWNAADAHALPASARWLQAQAGWTPTRLASPIHLLGGVLSIGFMVGISATNVAHELMHRRSPMAVLFSRILLVFSFDVPLVISHIHGHHVDVGTRKDHTTARRGESSYAYIWRSTLDGNLNAWRLEKARLGSQGRAAVGWGNRFLRGHAASVLATLSAWLVGGVSGVALFLVCAVLSKAILELINYIQHYGIVRLPGTPIALRHSWNSDKVVSSCLLFNVTRHSHHHAEPGLPYWALKSLPDAPALSKGYLTSICIALIPLWWHRHMAPTLLRWDQVFATPQEQQVAQVANRSSGVRRLVVGSESA